MTTLFISDLHLSADRPDITALFERFLQDEARHCDALYILGDLFDAWIGDDDLTPFHRQVIQALNELTSHGVKTYFIAGNRDFLIGRRFAKMTGIEILPEVHEINLYGIPTLLLHGDTLCTLDVGYLRFRRVIRNRWLLSVLTKLPLRWRRAIAAKLRRSSKSHQPLTPAQLQRMDVTEEGVQQALAEHAVERIIHGHTHRPNRHTHTHQRLGQVERIVLGDWYEQGSVLVITDTEITLQSRPLAQA